MMINLKYFEIAPFPPPHFPILCYYIPSHIPFSCFENSLACYRRVRRLRTPTNFIAYTFKSDTLITSRIQNIRIFAREWKTFLNRKNEILIRTGITERKLLKVWDSFALFSLLLSRMLQRREGIQLNMRFRDLEWSNQECFSLIWQWRAFKIWLNKKIKYLSFEAYLLNSVMS